MPPSSPYDRRSFIRKTAATGASLGLSAASYARIPGANERVGIAFLGCGGRAQAHLDLINRFRAAGQPIAIMAVSDVWDGQEDDYEQEFGGRVTKRKYAQGLYPSAKKVGLDPDDRRRVVKDYRRVLELADVDAVCIATPDHWHARMTIDAAAAGKHIYCEKPMTRTIDEAFAVVDAVERAGVVMTVGVQSMADPTWARAAEIIRAGRIGHIAQGQTGFYRNDVRGFGRYYRLTRRMTPKSIDWKMFLGTGFEVTPGLPLAPDMPFDRAAFGQWRCYWPFGAGLFTEMLLQQTTHMIAAMGVRMPSRVTASGGLYVERDGRDVPDIATFIAEYEQGCQLVVSGSTISSYPVEEVIRGRQGALRFTPRGIELFEDNPTRGSAMPPRLGDRPIVPAEVIAVERPKNETEALWSNFLDCIRAGQRQTASPPDLGAAALATIAMSLLSYRNGQALKWDARHRHAVPADGSWAARSEPRSGGTEPPAYMNLAGPWIDGVEPPIS